MKRTGFGPRKSTLKRSPFAQPTRQQFERNEEAKKRIGLKRKAKRPSVEEGSRYLAACRGQHCYLRVPGVCRLNPFDETVVPCHENSLAAGKGMGLKSSHERTVPGCFWCHAWLDQGKAGRWQKSNVFFEAYTEWVPVRARKMGLVEQQEMEVA